MNGKSFNQSFISHGDIVSGGELKFEMVSAPDYKWATAPESRPPAVMSAPAVVLTEAAHGATDAKPATK